MFLRQNNEKTTSDFIMCVCVHLKYIQLQNKSKTNDFLCQISRLFVLLKTIQITGKQHDTVIIRFEMYMYITRKMRILVFSSFNQMVSFEYYILLFTYGET